MSKNYVLMIISNQKSVIHLGYSRTNVSLTFVETEKGKTHKHTIFSGRVTDGTDALLYL